MLRNGGILNPRLLSFLASAGHGDVVVVADAGLPGPNGAPVVDLSLVPGVPSFADTTAAVLRALAVDSAVVAREAQEQGTLGILQEVLAELPTKAVSHEDLKRLTRSAHVVIRTGECRPFANVALIAGTTFPPFDEKTGAVP